jgi:hypothetical protein
MNLKIVAPTLPCFLLYCSLSLAEDSKYKNPISTLSVDSGYAFDSARAFWNFGQEIDGVVSTGYDALSSTFIGDFILTRAALAGVSYWGWDRLEYGFFVSNHELGHGARLYSYGWNPSYRWGEEAWLSNIFTFWSQGFTRYGQGAEATSLDPLTGDSVPDEYLIATIAGGMNNSAQYAEYIEDQIAYNGGGHILQYLGYVRAKEDAASYVDNTNGGQDAGDVFNTINIYQSKGFAITAQDLKTGSLVSRWASSTHYLFFVGAFNYLVKGNPKVNPFFLGGFKLPDLSHFITSRGISYKIRSGLKTGSGYFPVAVEYVYKGDTTVEASLGYRTGRAAGSQEYGFHLLANSKGGYGLSSDAKVFKTESTNVTLGASYYSEALLVGERLTGRYLSGGSGGYEIWGRLSYDY